MAKKFRWCNISDMEQRKCAELSKALQAVLTPRARSSFVKLSCIKAHNVEDCVKKIRGNVADAMSLDAADIYTAATFYDLTVVAKEIYQGGGCLYSVAVARDESLDIRQLKGKRSCHSGARRTAGWNIPLAFLLSQRYLQWRENQSVAEAASRFFSASCAPGVGASFPNLCALCQGQKSYNKGRNYFCETTNNEPYYGSVGALRCLEQGASDVAFLDNTALASMSVSEAAKYKLLCTDGTQANVTDFRKCHLGRGPGSAVVTRYNYRKITRKFLAVAQHLFGRSGKYRRRFRLFSSAGFNRKNLMFRDATVKLLLLADNTDIGPVLGLDYITLLKGLGHQGSSLENSIVRWCCISAAEQSKCEEWALNTKSTPLVCIRATSASHCIEMIKRDEVDAASLDATHAYIAGKCGLVPVVTEHYGASCASVNETNGDAHNVAEGRSEFPAGLSDLSVHGTLFYQPPAFLSESLTSASRKPASSRHGRPSIICIIDLRCSPTMPTVVKTPTMICEPGPGRMRPRVPVESPDDPRVTRCERPEMVNWLRVSTESVPDDGCRPEREAVEAAVTLLASTCPLGPPPIYAVAVVKKASRSENMFNLAGRRSCHSHVYSPAGWLLLAEHTVISRSNGTHCADVNKAYTDYFRKACMPGSSGKGKLCKVCIGREQAGSKPSNLRCAANHDELYYGNMGALRCLIGNSNGKNFGDVAFLEHHNLMKNIEWLGRSEWAPGWTSDDFELLCPGGGRAPVTEWDTCNLGPIPPNIVMTRSVIATKAKDFLMKSQEHLGPGSHSEFQLFQSQKYGESDLLFKDATKCLTEAAQLDYADILGHTFISLAKLVFSCTDSEILEFCSRDICSSHW
ncbi:saxiphilin-like [Pristis pectinata]|uniref:saxiphilin-like n=1 Tax=Pristis pectinata TaxID=685728 RepID=UPI00223DBADB|nr:saxiphilin-like [Pristis pectinata]